MNFWVTTGYRYIDLVTIREDELAELIRDMSRNDIIQWLCWNDPNGIYTDERSIKEFENILTKEKAAEILLRQCEENRVCPSLS